MEFCEVVERIEAAGGTVSLRYGRYFGSAYSDVLDASVEAGGIRISVTTGKSGLGSRLTEEHEQAVATMLAPIAGLVPTASRFRLPLPGGPDAAARLKSAGASDVRLAACGSRHGEGVWLEAVVEIDDVEYRIDTRPHGEAPEPEHAHLLEWPLNSLATWLEGHAIGR